MYNHTKPTLHVVVHVEEPYVVYNKATTKYEGFVYDIWQRVKTELQTQHTIEETYADTDDFSGVLQTYVRDRGYDIAVGAFSVFPERLTYCAFTVPYVLDKHVLLTSNEINWTKTLVVIGKKYLPVALFIALLGFLLAYLFRVVDVKHVSCGLTISAMMGNRDFLDSQKITKTTYTHNAFSYFCLFVLMLFATYTYVHLNAHVTRVLYAEHSADRITVDNIRGTRLLCAKGFSAGGLFEDYGARVDYEKVKDEDLVGLFRRTNASYTNNKHYDGIITTYLNSLHKYPEDTVRMNNTIFGYDKYCFGVHPRQRALLQRINAILSQLNTNHTNAMICASYFGLANKHLGVL